MDVRLYQAALRGDVPLLTQFLQEDSQLLVRALQDCSAKNNPLHIAARLGHFDFVREILTHQPQFARELNSQGQAPLHVASAKGHLQAVKELLRAYPDASYLHDKDGKTPLHRAAMKGRVKVLEELVRANKETAWLLTDQGDPVLHLCVNHNQFEALKMLVEAVDIVEFVNLKDDDDNTILHLLSAKNDYEVIKFLLTNNSGVDVNVVNVDGLTALDVSLETHSGTDRRIIRAILRSFGAERARKIFPAWPKKSWPKKKAQKIQNEKYKNWLSTTKQSLMVVATLMAGITFQAALNPPGGVWQDDGYHNSTLYHDPNFPPEQIPHRAGEAVISYILPGNYKAFTLCTALGLLASLSLILLLLSGFSVKRRRFIYVLIITTWTAVASIMVSYLYGYSSLTPHEINSTKFWIAVPSVTLACVLLIFIFFSIHVYRWRVFYVSVMVIYFKFVVEFLRKLCKFVVKFLCKLCHLPYEY